LRLIKLSITKILALGEAAILCPFLVPDAIPASGTIRDLAISTGVVIGAAGVNMAKKTLGIEAIYRNAGEERAKPATVSTVISTEARETSERPHPPITELLIVDTDEDIEPLLAA
jgi:hypothetical protein